MHQKKEQRGAMMGEKVDLFGNGRRGEVQFRGRGGGWGLSVGGVAFLEKQQLPTGTAGCPAKGRASSS